MTDTTNEHATAGTGTSAVQGLSGTELSELMDSAVRKAVAAQFAAAAEKVAGEVVEAFLTDEVRAQMTETAAHEAELALNPPISVDDHDEGQDDEQKPPPLKYQTVEAFVEGWITQIYRREVCERNVETRRRWCPQWWCHGEAKARLTALWHAFEDLRHGETVEQSLFWLVHLDPHMTRLLDPEGTFKYCSPSEGHNGLLAALPVVPAPAGYSSGEVADAAAGPPSGLILPPTITHRRVVHTTFP